ncbi:MAG: DUF1786 domain-containing protein [Chloroflexota bacterium]
MKILTTDIGTGTQDIFLYDSRLGLENGLKLIVPSPTLIVHRRIKEATRRGQPVLLAGVMMGGGPSGWAAEAHAKAGYTLYATPDAARTLNDDLDFVRALGVHLVSADEAARLPEEVLRIDLCDFDFPAICRAFESFGVSLVNLDAVAVAVFDHGDAPPGYSDRQFRFDYLDERIRAENRLSAFAYQAEDIPPILTRLHAVAASAQGVDAPLVVMDTAPAAVLGATFDPAVAACHRKLIANVGNFHTLAFRLGPSGEIEGVFEHHTGLLDLPRLEHLLHALADGSLQHSDVFDDHGHGALVYASEPFAFGTGAFDVAVTGPRRAIFAPAGRATPRAYFPAPFGDMMITGCFGLLAAAADVIPAVGETIRASLRGERTNTAPWDTGET